MNEERRHPATTGLLRYFEKLPVSEPTKANADSIRHQCAKLAESMTVGLADGPELTTGLRKLLEAKDCFVRAAIADGGYSESWIPGRS